MMTRAEYEQRRVNFTKHVLRLALQAREAKYGKIEDGRVMLDFIWRGAFFAAKLWDDGLQLAGVDVEPDRRTDDEILRDVEALLESAPGAEK